MALKDAKLMAEKEYPGLQAGLGAAAGEEEIEEHAEEAVEEVWCSRNPIVASLRVVETHGTCSERRRQRTTHNFPARGRLLASCEATAKVARSAGSIS